MTAQLGEVTRYEVAEQLLRSVGIQAFRRAFRKQQHWARIFPGYRPDSLTRSIVVDRPGGFARDVDRLNELLDVYLDDLGVPMGKQLQRLQTLMADPRPTEEVKRVLTAPIEGTPIALMPVGEPAFKSTSAPEPPPPGEYGAEDSTEPSEESTQRPAGHPDTNGTEVAEESPAPADLAPSDEYQLHWDRPDDDVSDIQDMVTLFERSLVALVRHRLEEYHGPPWLKRGCGPLIKGWREKSTANKKPGVRSATPQDLIGYADLGELLHLIINGTNWPTFAPIFGDKTFIERHFLNILALRNSGMHAGGRELYAAQESAGIGAMQSVAEKYDRTVAQTIDEQHRQLLYPEIPTNSPTVAAFTKMATNLREVRDPNLVGRETELRALSEFWSDTYTRVASIIGIGGVGKTALLDQFTFELMTAQCATNEAPTPEMFIFLTAKQNYLPGMTMAPKSQHFGTAREIYEALLVAAGDEGTPDRPLDELRRDAFSIASKAPVLFALDNLETIDGSDWEEVRDFLDDLPRPSKAIVTTRDDRRQGRSVLLSGLERDSAVELIRKAATRHGAILDEYDDEVLGAIASATDGVPLYLVFCGNAIGQGCSTAEALERLQGEELIKFLEFSFKTSFDTMNDESVAVAYYLALSGEPRRYQDLKTVCPKDELLTQAITKLRQLSFIDVTTQGKRTAYRISAPQLSEYSAIAARERLSPQLCAEIGRQAGVKPSATIATNVAIEVERAIADAEDSASSSNWQAGIEILEEARGRWGDAPMLLDRLGTFYWKMHQRSRARDLLEKAIKGGLRFSTTFFTLGLVSLYEGDYANAVTQAQMALNERPNYPQAELLLGDALSKEAVSAQLMISPERKRETLLEAKRHVAASFIDDDIQGWQRQHNQLARDTRARIERELGS